MDIEKPAKEKTARESTGLGALWGVIVGYFKIELFSPQRSQIWENLLVKPCAGRFGAQHIFFSHK